MARWTISFRRKPATGKPRETVLKAAQACEQWLTIGLMSRAMLLGGNEAKGFLAAHARIALIQALRDRAGDGGPRQVFDAEIVRQASEIAVKGVLRRMTAEGWHELADAA